VTYKLKLNGGDIKAVQGDSGHAQVNMVTDVYSHILDDDRKKNAGSLTMTFNPIVSRCKHFTNIHGLSKADRDDILID
jgi:hypothetical protein